MTVGTVFEGAVELGMHGGYREEHDSDMEPERHWAKEGYGPWRCQRAIPTDAWNRAIQPLRGVEHGVHRAGGRVQPMGMPVEQAR